MKFVNVLSCPVCGARESSLVGVRTINLPGLVDDFELRRCGGCGHWHTTPTPTQEGLRELYGSGSEAVMSKGWDKGTSQQFDANFKDLGQSPGEHSIHFRSRWIIDDIANQPPGNYLEFGPGDGACLRAFQIRGWRCHTIEVGGWFSGVVNNYISIDDLPEAARFDVIVANDVLEHIVDPLRTLQALAQRLHSGGRIYLSFPNAESLRARIGKVKWRMVSPIGHLHYFSRASVEALLIESGLDSVKLVSYDVLGPRSFSGLLVWLRQFLRQSQYRVAAAILVQWFVSRCIEAIHAGDQWRLIGHRRS